MISAGIKRSKFLIFSILFVVALLVSKGEAATSDFFVWWPTVSNHIMLQHGPVSNANETMHNGIDFLREAGDDVMASLAGEVVFVGSVKKYGNVVYVNSFFDGKYVQIRYANLDRDSIALDTADYISLGRRIGKMAKPSKNADLTYLHFEILQSKDKKECKIDGSNALNLDPMDYLNAIKTYDTSVISKKYSLCSTLINSKNGAENELLQNSYLTNKDIRFREAYLERLVDFYGWENEGLDRQSISSMKIFEKNGADNSVTVRLNNKERKYLPSDSDVKIVNGHFVVNIQKFKEYFYKGDNPLVRFSSDTNYSKKLAGKKNDGVEKIQQRLSELGYKGVSSKSIVADGDFGQNTEKAVSEFKALTGLVNSSVYYGVVDKNTWNVLFSENAHPNTSQGAPKRFAYARIKPFRYNSSDTGKGVDFEVPTQTQVTNYIIKKSKEMRISDDMALAVAWTETPKLEVQYDKNNTNTVSKKIGLMKLDIEKIQKVPEIGTLNNEQIIAIKNNWQVNVDYGLKYLKYCYQEAVKDREGNKGYREARKNKYSILWGSGLNKNSNLVRAAYSKYDADVTWRYRIKKQDAKDSSIYGGLINNYDLNDYTFWDNYSRKPWSFGTKLERYRLAYGDAGVFVTEEQAKAHMKDVKVNIWDYNSEGKLFSKVKYLTVNRNIAKNVEQIFKEIYKRKTPIKAEVTGAFNFRPGEHSQGLAIDINWSENYCVVPDGSIVAGKGYDPFTNKYAMHPDGAIVKTFKKYGWEWGGDWYTLKDFMHFSFIAN